MRRTAGPYIHVLQAQRVCVVCNGQGRIQLPCQGCRGTGCNICAGMGWVYVTCARCGGSGYS